MFFQWTDYRTTIIDSQFTWENIPCEQKKLFVEYPISHYIQNKLLF